MNQSIVRELEEALGPPPGPVEPSPELLSATAAARARSQARALGLAGVLALAPIGVLMFLMLGVPTSGPAGSGAPASPSIADGTEDAAQTPGPALAGSAEPSPAEPQHASPHPDSLLALTRRGEGAEPARDASPRPARDEDLTIRAGSLRRSVDAEFPF